MSALHIAAGAAKNKNVVVVVVVVVVGHQWHGRVHVELQHHVHVRPNLGRRPQDVPGGPTEVARAADDGELPYLVVDPVAAGHHERAAVVGPRGEDDGDGDHDHLLVLRAQHVGALRPADGPGVAVAVADADDARPVRDEVVDRHRVAEGAIRHGLVRQAYAPDEPDRRPVRPPDHVVHVQLQVHATPATATRRRRGHG